MQNSRAALLPGKFFALEFVNFIFKRLYGDFAAALCHSCDQMRSDLLNLGRYEFVHPNELYCVEFALCCAYSAADAAVFVEYDRAAAEAAFGLFFHLLLGERSAQIVHRFSCLVGSGDGGLLTRCGIISADGERRLGFIQRGENAPVTAEILRLTGVNVPVYRNCALLAGGNGVDNERRPCNNIAACEHVRLAGLVRKLIDRYAAFSVKLH